jgi:hypothetical protein
MEISTVSNSKPVFISVIININLEVFLITALLLLIASYLCLVEETKLTKTKTSGV